MKPITIYTPPGTSQATLTSLRQRFPTAVFVNRYQEGAIPWQELAKKE